MKKLKLIKRIAKGEYDIGEFSISHKAGTDWTISGPSFDGGFYRETCESFKDAKETAQKVAAEWIASKKWTKKEREEQWKKRWGC